MSGFVACQTEQSDDLTKLIDCASFNNTNWCIVSECDEKIEKCKVISGILTPFCDNHIKMIRNNKVLNVCSGCYHCYINKCKELMVE